MPSPSPAKKGWSGARSHARHRGRASKTKSCRWCQKRAAAELPTRATADGSRGGGRPGSCRASEDWRSKAHSMALPCSMAATAARQTRSQTSGRTGAPGGVESSQTEARGGADPRARPSCASTAWATGQAQKACRRGAAWAVACPQGQHHGRHRVPGTASMAKRHRGSFKAPGHGKRHALRRAARNAARAAAAAEAGTVPRTRRQKEA